MEQKSTTRMYSLDLLRVCAIVLVLVCHVSKAGLNTLEVSALDTVSSFGVPLFAMLTGYLMLGRNYTVSYTERYVKRNIFPMFVAIELWNIIWWIAGSFIPDAASVDFGGAVKMALFARESGSAFWYMHMIFALYLGLPILSHVAKAFQSNRMPRVYRNVLLMALVWFGCVIPTGQHVIAA